MNNPSSVPWLICRNLDHEYAFALSDVLETMRPLDTPTLTRLPPLLSEAAPHTVSAIAALDTGLLLVLQSAHLLPQTAWQTLAAQELTL